MILEIPRVSHSLNTLLRWHWRHRYRDQQAWKMEVLAALCNQGSFADREPLTRARICIERRTPGGRLDPDNLVGSIKPVLDALRYNKVIVDDTPDHIELQVSQATGPRRTRIEVEPLT